MPAPLSRRILAAIPALILAGTAYLLRRLPRRDRPAEPPPPAPAPGRGFALAAPEHAAVRPRLRKALGATAVLLVILAGLAGALVWNHETGLRQRSARAAALVGGNPDRAPRHMLRFGCAGCHRVAGLAGPQGLVGPPLDRLAERVYLAGQIPSTPENLIRWIRDPKGIDPRTAMPVTGISDEEARDVAAYLLAR